MKISDYQAEIKKFLARNPNSDIVAVVDDKVYHNGSRDYIYP